MRTPILPHDRTITQIRVRLFREMLDQGLYAASIRDVVDLLDLLDNTRAALKELADASERAAAASQLDTEAVQRFDDALDTARLVLGEDRP